MGLDQGKQCPPDGQGKGGMVVSQGGLKREHANIYIYIVRVFCVYSIKARWELHLVGFLAKTQHRVVFSSSLVCSMCLLVWGLKQDDMLAVTPKLDRRLSIPAK